MPDAAPDPEPYHVYAARDGVRVPWHDPAWWQAFGVVLDGMLDGAQAAVASRWPSKAPVDVLRIIGTSVGMPQGPSETDEEYRIRLRFLWALAESRGTLLGVTSAIQLLNIGVEIYEPWTNVGFGNTWGRQKNPGPGVNPARQRWFNVVILHPHPFGDDFSFRYGDGSTYGSGKLYGVNGDPRWIPLLQQIVRTQKPAHAFCEWIAVVLDGGIKKAGLVTDGDPFDASSRVAYIPV
jgi:hypothetical protein